MRLLRDSGARIEIVYIEPSHAALFKQIRDREARVSEQAILALLAKLDPPRLVEVHSLRIEAM